MYYVQIIGKDFNKTLCCKRIYLRTELGILNILTENNEYLTFDLKELSYFDIEIVKPNEIRLKEILKEIKDNNDKS